MLTAAADLLRNPVLPAVAAFNVITLEFAEGIVRGAERAGPDGRCGTACAWISARGTIFYPAPCRVFERDGGLHAFQQAAILAKGGNELPLS